ncbi:MAG TPA: ADP-ribosyltransferase [Baekduia sp.]|nr:ADP-ribosyltransferase [Baekduia sp.]
MKLRTLTKALLDTLRRIKYDTYQKRYTALVDDFLKFTADPEAQAWLEAEFGEWVRDLPEDLRDALVDYKNSAYDRLNDELRNGFESDEHHQLDRAIASHTLREAVIAYRGIIDGDEGLHEFVEGAEVGDLGYWSLSLLEEVAWGFASTGSYPTARVVFRIFLDAGTTVIYAAAPDLVEEMHEYELLLPRSSKFRVIEPAQLRTAKANNETYYLIDLELIE